MSGKQSVDVMKEITRRIKELHIFDRILDRIKIVSIGSGNCVAEYSVAQEHSNIGGTMHGGFAATLVDCISTYALISHGKGIPGVSLDLHVQFLKAAPKGEELIIDARTIRAGKSHAFLEVAIKNKKNGQLLVTGTHTKFLGQ